MSGGSDLPNTLRLAMVLDNTEYAELISNHFRNGGVAVRSAIVHTFLETMESLKNPTDIIVCEIGPEIANSLSRMKDICLGVNAQHKDIPIIALLNTYNSTEVLTALENGASNCVPIDNIGFLERVLKHEWRNYIARRQSVGLLTQIKESNKRCDNLIDSSKDPIAYIHQGMHIRANSAYLNLFEFEDFDEAEAVSLLDLIRTDVDAFKAFLKKQHQDNQSHVFPAHIKTMNENHLDVEMEFSPAWYEGEECLQVMVRVPHTIESEHTSSDIDPVTKLLSRPHFIQQTKQLAKNGRSTGILGCSLDTYSDLFQSVSLETLDIILSEFAQRLKRSVPSDATIGRIGESKFAVWTSMATPEDLNTLAEKIYAEFDGWVLNVNNNSVALPAKISGIHWRTPSEDNVDGMVWETIKMLQAAKSRVHVASASHIAAIGHEGQTTTDGIEDALEHHRIEVAYSPIQALHGQSFAFYIADAVLFDDNQTLVDTPDDLSIDLVKRVQRERIGAILRSLAHEHITPSSKILLPLRLLGEDSDWIDQLCAEIRSSQLPSQLFVVEFQEKDLTTKLSDAQNIVRKLKSLGMEIGLGGFGGSEQSVFLLQHINPQWVRFEKNMLVGLTESPENQQRLKELTALAQESGKKVIASDVNDAMSMATLFASNIEYAQGDFLSPPLSHLPRN